MPLPANFTWPHAQTPDEAETDEESDGSPSSDDEQTGPDDETQATGAEDEADGDDDEALPEQQDERWEQALPLNGTNVGDLVLPALPISPTDGAQQQAAAVAADASHASASTIFDAGRSYDWLKPNT